MPNVLKQQPMLLASLSSISSFARAFTTVAINHHRPKPEHPSEFPSLSPAHTHVIQVPRPSATYSLSCPHKAGPASQRLSLLPLPSPVLPSGPVGSFIVVLGLAFSIAFLVSSSLYSQLQPPVRRCSFVALVKPFSGVPDDISPLISFRPSQPNRPAARAPPYSQASLFLIPTSLRASDLNGTNGGLRH